jgi:hypothetical protein
VPCSKLFVFFVHCLGSHGRNSTTFLLERPAMKMKRAPANGLNAHKRGLQRWRDPPVAGGPGSRRRSELKNFCFPEDQSHLDLAIRGNQLDTGITARNEKARISGYPHQAWWNLHRLGRDHRCSRTRQGRRRREVRRVTRKQLRLGKRTKHFLGTVTAKTSCPSPTIWL